MKPQIAGIIIFSSSQRNQILIQSIGDINALNSHKSYLLQDTSLLISYKWSKGQQSNIYQLYTMH